MLLDGDLEHEEFADEADGEGNASEGNHGGEHGEGELGGAFAEAVEMGDVVAAGVICHNDHDEEREERHEQVAAEVE